MQNVTGKHLSYLFKSATFFFNLAFKINFDIFIQNKQKK